MNKHYPFGRYICGSLISLSIAFFNAGCVSNQYKKAKESTPPPVWLNVAFPPAQLEAMLNSVITFNGPGSWKRDAFWDEYVVTLRNPGNQFLIVISADLIDYAHNVRPARNDPWTLESESKSLEQKYKDDRIAFARNAVPGVLILGVGAVAATSAGYIVTWGAGGVAAGAGAAAAAATVVALPLYYGAVLYINHSNKRAMETEFNRRRFTSPLMLAPGEARTTSLFFPMGPNPHSLSLRWSMGTINGESVLPLDFLKGLHIEAPSKSKDFR